MPNQIDFMEIIALLGTLHGFFLGIVIWSHSKGNRLANRILGILILLYAFDLLEIVAYWTRWLEQAPHLWGLTFFFPYLYGVLLCGYVRAAEDSSFRLRRFQALHLLPFAFCVLFYTPFYFSNAQGKLHMLRAGYPESGADVSPNLIMMVFWSLQFLHFLVYLAWAWRFLGDSEARDGRRHWLRFLLICFALTFSAWFCYGMAVAWGFPYARIIDFSAVLAMTLTIYAIGYAALRKPELLLGPAERKRVGRYQASTLDESDAVRYQARLLQVMEKQKPFKDAELRLDNLASLLGISSHQLSQLINQKFEQNFNDFINRYRVEEAKRLLADPERVNDTVLSLAFEAGFNNKTSFNSSFKKHVDMTPSRFRAGALAREQAG